MPYIVEPLPSEPHDASIVLHVRAHTRRKIDPVQQESTPEQLRARMALLFGVDETILATVDLSKAPSQRERLALAASAIAKQTGSAAVPLGHDVSFVQRCVRWLAARVDGEPAFKDIFANDSRTLLVLSEALDIATTRSPKRRAPICVFTCE